MRNCSIVVAALMGCFAFTCPSSRAGMIFSGGWVESRAYSGLTPDGPIDRAREPIDSLPFDSESSAAAGITHSDLEHDVRATTGGAEFRWGLNQTHDGGPFSFAVSEGELAFQVTETSPFALQGDYAFSGPGIKRAFFRLYDSPADMSPVFQWDEESREVASSFAPQGAGDLHPGVGYRLAYRLLLDNHNQGEPGTTAGNLRFTIGEPVRDGLVGDTDGNGRIDVTDLNHVRNNFGQQANPVLGDTYPFDGRVDIQDLNAVRNLFGTARPQLVPEPDGRWLALAGAVALVGFHRQAFLTKRPTARYDA